MPRVPYSTGTVAVANGDTIVTLTGGTLTALNCREGYDVIIEGVANYVASRTDTTTFELVMPHEGAGGSGLNYAIRPISAEEIATATLNARTAELLEQLSVVQANGRGLFMVFEDSTTDADPGAGNVRLNNATIGSATAAYIDNLDANGATVSGIVDSWDDQGTASARGQLWLRSVADPAAFHAFRVTDGVVDGTGYRKLTLVHVGGSGSFAAGDELMVMFSPQGADGSNAVLGVWQGEWQTATDYDDAPDPDLVRFDGSTYICTEAHTSGTFATDLAAGKWELAVEKGDTGATGATGATGDTGPTGPGFDHKGAYSGGTAYVADDVVTYQGSSWIALGATTGNAPPSLPTTSNTWWELFAQKGADGAGTIASIIGGTGIDIDVTDPANPEVSIDPTWVLDEDDMASDSPDRPPSQQSVKAYVDSAVGGIDGFPEQARVNAASVGGYQAKSQVGFTGYRRGKNTLWDGFADSSGLNVGRCSNYAIDAAKFFKATDIAGTSSVSVSLVADSGQTTARTHRNWIAAGVVSTSGAYVRARMRGPAAGTPKTLNNVFIGHSTTAPNFDAAPVRLTFSGGNSVTPAAGSFVWSDWVAFALDETKNLMIAYDFTQTGSEQLRYLTSAGANYEVYIKDSVAEAGTQTVSGYSNSDQLWVVDGVEVKSSLGVNNATYSSALQTADAAVTSVTAYFEIDTIDAITLGTDLTGIATCNGWTNNGAVTLTNMGKGQSGRTIVRATASGLTSGTSFGVELVYANNKNAPIYWTEVSAE